MNILRGKIERRTYSYWSHHAKEIRVIRDPKTGRAILPNGLPVWTIVHDLGQKPVKKDINDYAAECGLPSCAIERALAYYVENRDEIDAIIRENA